MDVLFEETGKIFAALTKHEKECDEQDAVQFV